MFHYFNRVVPLSRIVFWDYHFTPGFG